MKAGAFGSVGGRQACGPAESALAASLRILPASAVLLALWFSLGLAGRADAESGAVHPWRGAGLNVDVDTRWLDGGGYRPVRITVTPVAPVTADRTLTVEFSARRFGNRQRDDLRVVQDVEIPAGSGPVRSTMSVPHAAGWNAYTINLLEDGKLRAAFPRSGTGFDAVSVARAEVLPKLLVVGDRLPDTSAVACLFDASVYGPYGAQVVVAQQGPVQLPTAMAKPAAELPFRWIDYTNLDLVCLSVEQLAALRLQQPERLRALVEWTSAGGNLCAYGVGTQWERLGELESLLGLAPGSDSEVPDPHERGWTEPARDLFGQVMRGAGSEISTLLMAGMEAEMSPEFPPLGAAAATAPEDGEERARWYAQARQTRPDDCFSFVFRDLHMGMVVAVADENPFRSAGPREVLGWSWMLNSIGAKRLLWYRRHGLSAWRENTHFWNFLIPGVGLPPMTAFRVLITLFVLAIGPANYLLLRRWKRLHLLVVTVPVSAAAVTLALFAYAMVADGFGTRVRVRSLTCIDRGQGRAACWSRLSYYAGLTPYGGLRFPSDVAVIPLEFLPQEDRSRTQELLWGESQWMARGWLPARTPTQFLTVRSRPTKLHLRVRQSEDRPGSLEVENHLGTRIEHLLIRARDGQHFWAADVEAGATTGALPIDVGDARDRLRRTLGEHQPKALMDLDRRQWEAYADSRDYRRWRRRGSGATEALEPSQWSSLLEESLGDVQAAKLEPGSYAAVAERSPEVVLGIDSPREQAGLHVIVGTW